MKHPVTQFFLLALLGVNTIAVVMLINKVDRLESIVIKPTSTNITLPENFEFAFTRMQAFYPSIDTSTVIKIVATANKFELTNKMENFKWGIGQLLTESGGSQYHKEGTPKAGKVLISSGGAIGIGQILPSTAYGYITSRAKDDDKKILKELGCSDFSFMFDKKKSKKVKIAQAKDWLKNETNNIALWGFIMKNNIEKKKNVMTALATYNMGDGGIKTYLDSGQSVANNDYVVAVKQKIDLVEAKLN